MRLSSIQTFSLFFFFACPFSGCCVDLFIVGQLPSEHMYTRQFCDYELMPYGKMWRRSGFFLLFILGPLDPVSSRFVNHSFVRCRNGLTIEWIVSQYPTLPTTKRDLGSVDPGHCIWGFCVAVYRVFELASAFSFLIFLFSCSSSHKCTRIFLFALLLGRTTTITHYEPSEALSIASRWSICH